MKRTQESKPEGHASKILIFSSTLYIVVLLIQTATAQLDPNEITALHDLYQGTNGPKSWKQKWDLNSSDHCNWYGIRCNAGKTKVEQM